MYFHDINLIILLIPVNFRDKYQRSFLILIYTIKYFKTILFVERSNFAFVRFFTNVFRKWSIRFLEPSNPTGLPSLVLTPWQLASPFHEHFYLTPLTLLFPLHFFQLVSSPWHAVPVVARRKPRWYTPGSPTPCRVGINFTTGSKNFSITKSKIFDNELD